MAIAECFVPVGLKTATNESLSLSEIDHKHA
jgi:hypothetical protein